MRIYSRIPPGRHEGAAIGKQFQDLAAFAEGHGFQVERPVADQTGLQLLRRDVATGLFDVVVVVDRDTDTP